MEHLMISSETVVKIPLNEIAVLMIENPNIVLTGHIINALSSYKIATIICDSKMNPSSIIHSVYGHHRQSKHIRQQVEWTTDRKGILWQEITKQKIFNQSRLLTLLNKEGAEELKAFIDQVEVHDTTNREGHAAKVYFNRLFGHGFHRACEEPRNWALNYGYMVLHALIARQIVSKGYLTELGIHHINEFNQLNLASDLIEVFRPLVDYVVYENINGTFNKEDKRKLLGLLEYKISIRKSQQYLQQCIQIYLDGCIHYLNGGDMDKVNFPFIQYESLG